MRIHTTHTRDAALQQLQRLNRWLIAGSVLLTGAFTEAAAQAFPGRTVKKASAAGVSTAGKTHEHGAGDTATSSTTAAPLKPPAQSPRAAGESSSPQAQEAAPARESQATQEPAQEPAPEHESAPAQHTEPSSPPAEAPHESAPEPQPEPEPVVSGGS
jgi:threonine synthase